MPVTAYPTSVAVGVASVQLPVVIVGRSTAVKVKFVPVAHTTTWVPSMSPAAVAEQPPEPDETPLMLTKSFTARVFAAVMVTVVVVCATAVIGAPTGLL